MEDILIDDKVLELEAYTRDTVFTSALEYFNGDEIAADTWINKYALKDSDGKIYELNPRMMHDRIADELYRIEKSFKNSRTRKDFFDLLDEFKYVIPQGRPMAGIGNPFQTVTLSNCFVIGNDGPADSYGAILKTDEEQVQLMKRGGGVGHDVSHIRPAKTSVKNASLYSTGVVPFMERYSNSTREVAQDGRRGALMLSIHMQHPESSAVIDAKMEEGKITGANVSIRIPDSFMRAVEKDGKYTRKFPIDENLEASPYDKAIITDRIEAKPIWDKIIFNAWKSAEPGVLFWDKIISESIADRYADYGFKTVSTNPCAEIPLCSDDSCRLIAMNLYSYVVNPFTKKAQFNFDKFKADISTMVRMMDDIIELELEKIDEMIKKIEADPETYDIKRTELSLWKRIKKKCVDGRRTGMGVTAVGDMLAALGIRYGTQKASDFMEDIHKLYIIESLRESVNLAKERGAFPIFDWEREKNVPIWKRISKEDPALIKEMAKVGRRHIALMTIAPTGSVSIMTQTSSGIEPAFLLFYKRRRKINPNDKNTRVDFIDKLGDKWEEYQVFHHKFATWLDINGYDPDIISKVNDESLEKIVKKSPYYKATSADIDWVEKINMQGRIQKWVDHSISVTVNLPKEVDVKTVNDVYIAAWKAGCKGCTIYRDGSRDGVLISNKEKAKEKFFAEHDAPKRPKSLECNVTFFQNAGERWVGLTGLLEGKPYEIFTGKLDNFPIPSYVEGGHIVRFKKNGVSNYNFVYKCKFGNKIIIPNLNNAFDKRFHDYAKTISAILRHGMPLPYVIDLINGLNLDGDLITTWKKGVIRMLKKQITNGTEYMKQPTDCPQPELNNCKLVYEEGCLNCKTCGKAKCG